MNSIRRRLITSGVVLPVSSTNPAHADPQAILARRRLDPVTPSARAMNVLYTAADRPPTIVYIKKRKPLMASLLRPTLEVQRG